MLFVNYNLYDINITLLLIIALTNNNTIVNKNKKRVPTDRTHAVPKLRSKFKEP